MMASFPWRQLGGPLLATRSVAVSCEIDGAPSSEPSAAYRRQRNEASSEAGKGSIPSISRVGEPRNPSLEAVSASRTRWQVVVTDTWARLAAIARRSINTATLGQSSTCSTVTATSGVDRWVMDGEHHEVARVFHRLGGAW